jgi:hypothetical protein
VVSYTDLGHLYGHHLTLHGIPAAMLTHKWQPADLLAPHSDLDVRVILDVPPASWWQWNEQLAAAHGEAVAQSGLHRRLLEHPPGFAFTLAELEDQLVAPPELATWSLITGNPCQLQRWKSRAQMTPWNTADERFYRGILNARTGGLYQLTEDSTDNVHHDLDGYRRHCISWHYVAPCWFAAAALATRTRIPGKSAALHQWHPGELGPHAEEFLHHGSPHQPVSELLRTAHVTVEAVLRHVPMPRATSPASGAAQDATAWVMAAGMLRVRVARWLYYLSPPPQTATTYLITREEKELQVARKTLLRLADVVPGPDGRLASALADLIPDQPTTPASLRALLSRWQQHRTVVEDFLSTRPA